MSYLCLLHYYSITIIQVPQTTKTYARQSFTGAAQTHIGIFCADQELLKFHDSRLNDPLSFIWFLCSATQTFDVTAVPCHTKVKLILISNAAEQRQRCNRYISTTTQLWCSMNGPEFVQLCSELRRGHHSLHALCYLSSLIRSCGLIAIGALNVDDSPLDDLLSKGFCA